MHLQKFLTAAALATLLSWPALAASLVEVTAEFEITQWRYQEETGLPLKSQRQFAVRCVAGTNTWHIENQVRSNVTERLWFMDGKLARQVSVKLEDPDDEPAFGTTRRSARSVGMMASVDGYPGGEPGVTLTWFAFCSGPYLRRPGRAVPLPVLGQDRAAFGFADETTTFADDLGLPRRATLRTGQRQIKCDYQVTQSTNVNGWSFPTAFTVTQNEPDSLGRWRKSVSVTGRVTGIRPAAALVMPLEVQERFDTWEATGAGRKL